MLYAITAVLLVALDQIVKFIVKVKVPLDSSVDFLSGFLRITHVQNDGAAFRLFSGGRWPLIIITGIVLVVGIIILSRGIVQNRFGRWAATFVIAGALGNLIDRVLFGYVTDMFEFEFMRFAVFNVADIFVVCGGIAVCIYVFFMHKDKTPKNRTDSAGDDLDKDCV